MSCYIRYNPELADTIQSYDYKGDTKFLTYYTLDNGMKMAVNVAQSAVDAETDLPEWYE